MLLTSGWGKKKSVSHWSTQHGDASIQVPPFLGGDLRSRQCRCLITSAHCKMAAEVTEQTQAGSFSLQCGGLAQHTA